MGNFSPTHGVFGQVLNRFKLLKKGSGERYPSGSEGRDRLYYLIAGSINQLKKAKIFSTNKDCLPNITL